VTVSQRVGTFVARGGGSTQVGLCGSKARTWLVRMDSDTGVAFQEGAASLTLSTFTFDGFNSVGDERTENVTVGRDPNRMRTG
jgi:hypothetical protein